MLIAPFPIYIYVCVCVCLCVCLWLVKRNQEPKTRRQCTDATTARLWLVDKLEETVSDTTRCTDDYVKPSSSIKLWCVTGGEGRGAWLLHLSQFTSLVCVCASVLQVCMRDQGRVRPRCTLDQKLD